VRADPSPRRFDGIAQRGALVLLPIAIVFFVWLVFAGAGNETSAPFSGPPAPAHVTPRAGDSR